MKVVLRIGDYKVNDLGLSITFKIEIKVTLLTEKEYYQSAGLFVYDI